MSGPVEEVKIFNKVFIVCWKDNTILFGNLFIWPIHSDSDLPLRVKTTKQRISSIIWKIDESHGPSPHQNSKIKLKGKKLFNYTKNLDLRSAKE